MIAWTGADARVEDFGRTWITATDPTFGITTTRLVRHWVFAWTGTLEDRQTAMQVRLTAGGGRCEERLHRGIAPCADPAPSRLVIACSRDELEIDGARRAIWRCQPDPPIAAGEWSGTPFPWVFGVDAVIDTVHAGGDPEPGARYQVRDRW
jgi:hypothetical protein